MSAANPPDQPYRGRSEHRICLCLGSNINPEKNLPLAVVLLAEQAQVLKVSTAWANPAIGGGGPDFINAAVLVSTPLDRQAFKAQVIHPIEDALGRVRYANPNAPRTIDIDIVIVDGIVYDSNLWKYAYMAVPIAEISPTLRHPETGEMLYDIAQRLSGDTVITPLPQLLRNIVNQV